MKELSVQELIDFGYLQEVNRRFFHPLGLALTAVVDTDPEVSPRLLVKDNREDPEGWEFAPGVMEPEKFRRVEEEWVRRNAFRLERLGFEVQPPPEEVE